MTRTPSALAVSAASAAAADGSGTSLPMGLAKRSIDAQLHTAAKWSSPEVYYRLLREAARYATFVHVGVDHCARDHERRDQGRLVRVRIVGGRAR
jgi:hypothetical protein